MNYNYLNIGLQIKYDTLIVVHTLNLCCRFSVMQAFISFSISFQQ